jgi:hypothetical protein
MIVLKTDWWQPAPSMQSAFKLVLSTYADGDGKITSNMFSGNALVEAKQKNFVDGYLMAPVKPGEVMYLGRFDALFHRQQLTEQAVNSGRIAISGYGFADFFDLPDGPRFSTVDEADMTSVRAMLTRQAPGITAPVHSVTFSPASFGTGSTLFAERKCGGYFNTSAKSKRLADRRTT